MLVKFLFFGNTLNFFENGIYGEAFELNKLLREEGTSLPLNVS